MTDTKQGNMIDQGQPGDEETILPPVVPVKPKLLPTKDANVILISGQEALPEGPANIGVDQMVEMPTADQQAAGFFVKNPGILLTQFQGKYKYLIAKGQDIPPLGQTFQVGNGGDNS